MGSTSSAPSSALSRLRTLSERRRARSGPSPIAQLAVIKRVTDRRDRLQRTRASAITEPDDLAAGEVGCRLHLETHDEQEIWLVLTANDIELHRELAAYESVEPAERLLNVMCERYADRLVGFDYSPAITYLGGDRIAAVDELATLVADLGDDRTAERHTGVSWHYDQHSVPRLAGCPEFGSWLERTRPRREGRHRRRRPPRRSLV